MRLFAAVDPPGDVRAQLDAVVGAREGDLRWVPVEQWHITLAFYGEVPDSRVDDLCARLARCAGRTAPFMLHLAGSGTFPRNPARARQLWVGVAGDTERLGRLAASCIAAGRRAGQQMEDRRYQPHLTLARARAREADVQRRVDALSAYAGAPWSVESFTLVRSTLGRSVTHRPLAELPLGEPER